MKVNEGEIGFNLYKGRGITTRGRRLWGSCRVDVSPVRRSGVARLPVVLTRCPRPKNSLRANSFGLVSGHLVKTTAHAQVEPPPDSYPTDGFIMRLVVFAAKLARYGSLDTNDNLWLVKRASSATGGFKRDFYCQPSVGYDFAFRVRARRFCLHKFGTRDVLASRFGWYCR